MPTPRAGYFLKDGSRVPGVTTILGRFKESGGLMHWAFKQGQSGAARLYDEAEKAADIGTIAHGMVERHIKREPDEVIKVWAAQKLLDPLDYDKALSSFTAYRKWAENFKVRVVAQELQLVSELYRYGGTPDAMGEVAGELALLDWKTSGAVYTDYLVQLAAYGLLWEENNPTRPITGGYHLLRFSKENGDFAHHYFANLDDGRRQFLLLREAYDLDKQLKKRAA